MSGFTRCPGPPQCTRCVVISGDIIADRYEKMMPPPPPEVKRVSGPVRAKPTNWKGRK
jgi:hypothetical protein